MPLYTIRPGERFLLPEGEVKVGGDVIELEEDAAALHLYRLEPVELPKLTDAVAKASED